MSPFVFAASKTALITGGASGIGLAVARKCLNYGMKVLIADNNDKLLAAARQSLGDKIMTFQADVSCLGDWEQLKKQVDIDLQGRVDLLVLNAGVQPSSGWEDPSQFRTIFDVNLFGVVNGIATFLSSVTANTGSAIVITGSKQGITNPPGNPAYNASKSAVKTIAEQLSYDLRGSRTSVYFLVPGWTFTGLGRSEAVLAGEKPAAAWTSQQVADYLEEKMNNDEFYIICPDNEVTEEMDGKRILWSAEDMIQRRPPLSRWRDEFKEEFARRGSSQ
ncbi:short chain dehydrogenase reductase [Colletotrichum incanum]|nr:short chain dehydrogenase reductase [Colletotrichum incanum]